MVENSHKMDHDHHGHHGDMMRDFIRRFSISTILTIPALILSPTFQKLFGYSLEIPGSDYLIFSLSLVIYLYGGWPFLKGTLREISKGEPGMMTLIGLAISVAFFYSSAVSFGFEGKTFYWELATLIDVMLLGHYLEMKSVMGASRALESLARLLPNVAHKLESGGVVDVPVEDLKPGDSILVKPGERIPVDGVIKKGETSLDESSITGESAPVHRGVGDEVIGGCVNLDGAIEVEVKGVGKDTYLMRVMELVERVRESRSRTQKLADRAARWLTYIALSSGGLTFTVWSILKGDVVFALERAVTVMVITCPHALGLAIPLVVSVSTAILAKRGILIRDSEAVEKASKLNAVVFDKTGTLTEGAFVVSRIVRLSDLPEERVLELASSVEKGSTHPIAKAILEKAESMNISVPQAEGVVVIPGKGVRGKVNGAVVEILSEREISRLGFKVVEGEAETVVYVLLNGGLIGAIALSDEVRDGAREAIEDLKRSGMKVYMLTGDREEVAKKVAKQLNLDGYFSELLPHEKVEKIKELKRKGMNVAMVGDGINDAPALLESDLGMAIGAGTDVAVESADVILVRSDPGDVPRFLKIAKRAYAKMKQNLVWATGYNAVAIPLAGGVLYRMGVLLSPAIGAVLMTLSTIIVALNARSLRG